MERGLRLLWIFGLARFRTAVEAVAVVEVGEKGESYVFFLMWLPRRSERRAWLCLIVLPFPVCFFLLYVKGDEDKERAKADFGLILAESEKVGAKVCSLQGRVFCLWLQGAELFLYLFAAAFFAVYAKEMVGGRESERGTSLG